MNLVPPDQMQKFAALYAGIATSAYKLGLEVDASLLQVRGGAT